MTLNDIINRIDFAPGAKTTYVAALLLLVAALQWFGIITPEQFDTAVSTFIAPALAVTLGLKVVRKEASPLVTGAGLAVAAAAAASLVLGGCVLTVGPEGRYISADLDPGVCLAANAGSYIGVAFGFCTEGGASTETLEASDTDEE